MFGIIETAAIAGFEMAVAEEKAFRATLEGLPEPERQRRIERRQDRLAEDRRHREMTRAMKQQSSGPSMAKIILGAALFGSMCN